MNKFIEVTASKMSLAKRKPIYGIGINDSSYITFYKIDGKRYRCPFYRVWTNMLKRCYSDVDHIENPTYKDCTVCEEWLTFSRFKCWMESQDWKGKQLDKDLLYPLNKLYSPNRCAFIDQEINLILSDPNPNRSLPRGVYAHKKAGKFAAECSVNGKGVYLGLFSSPEDAGEAYRVFKSKIVIDLAETQPEPIRSALLNHFKLV